MKMMHVAGLTLLSLGLAIASGCGEQEARTRAPAGAHSDTDGHDHAEGDGHRHEEGDGHDHGPDHSDGDGHNHDEKPAGAAQPK